MADIANQAHDGSRRTADFGVSIAEQLGLGCATVIVRRDMLEHLTQRVKETYGLNLVVGPRRTASGNTAFLGVGPATWLAIQADGGNAYARSLKQAVGEAASVSDQTDGYIVYRLCGRRVRRTLAKGFPIDVDERAFAVGDVAVTTVSHIGAIIWRLEDLPDGSPAFEVAVFRSLAESFRRWLEVSAGEFGPSIGLTGRG